MDPTSRRRRRLAEELSESGVHIDGADDLRELLLEEVDLALRPAVHERRVPSSGTIIGPTAEPAHWASATGLEIQRPPLSGQSPTAARRFADGLSSWIVRRTDGDDEWVVFDRSAGSERDLGVLADAFGAVIVQR